MAATDVGDIAPTLPQEARAGAVPPAPPPRGNSEPRSPPSPRTRSAQPRSGRQDEARVIADFSLEAMVERYRAVYESAMAR